MDSPNLVSLVTGNPFNGTGPASYSRFVLPFSYKLTKENYSPNRPVYWSESPVSAADPRYKYFTKETSKVLFEQARWFELEGLGECTFTHEDYSISLSTPRLVLFEFSENPEPSILETGFLILEVFFQHRDCGAPLEVLLELNEVLRYKQKPYAEYDDVRGLALNQKFCTNVHKWINGSAEKGSSTEKDKQNNPNPQCSNFQLSGGVGNDRMTGMDGDDQVFGEDGDDTVLGGDGNDVLFGNAGSDTVLGEDGDDAVHGGAGANLVAGNQGNDRPITENSSTKIDETFVLPIEVILDLEAV